MTLSPEAAGIICAGAAALLSLSYRRFMVERRSALALSFVNSVGGGLILLPFLSLGDFTGLNWASAALLLLGAALWALSVYWDIKAYEDLGATLNAILNVSRLVLLFVLGVLFFSEHADLADLSGIALVAGGVLLNVRRGRLTFNRGARFRMLSVCSGAIALTIDKQLTTLLPLEVVIASGYFCPAALYLLFRRDTLPETGHLLRTTPVAALVTTVLIAVLGYMLLFGIGKGDLGTTVVLTQLSVVFVFFGGALFLNERDDLWRRGAASALVVVGAILVAR